MRYKLFQKYFKLKLLWALRSNKIMIFICRFVKRNKLHLINKLHLLTLHSHSSSFSKWDTLATLWHIRWERKLQQYRYIYIDIDKYNA